MPVSARVTDWIVLAVMGTAVVVGLPGDACAAGLPATGRLTADGVLKFSPVFINEGRTLVFSAHSEPSRVSIVEFDLVTGKQKSHYPPGSDAQFDIAFSPDRSLECFSRSGGPRQLSLVIRNPKTSKDIVFHPPGTLRSTIRTPRFLPDGKRIVMTMNSPGGQQIVSISVQGTDVKKLTASNGLNAWPAVSPDGKTIVFSSSRRGDLDLWLMDSDGNNQRRLLASPRRDIYPSWSPDGSRIAFTSSRDGNQEVYIVDRDGENLVRVTRHPERDTYPVWHPDGKRLLTISERRGRFDFYLWDVAVPRSASN